MLVTQVSEYPIGPLLKMGPTGCPETLITANTNCATSQKSKDRRGWILKSSTDFSELMYVPERGWKTTTVPVVWATFGIFSAMRDPTDFLSRLVTMDEIWLYHCDPETKRSNNQWSVGIAAHTTQLQKIPSAKIRCKSSRLHFLGSRRHPPHWLSSKGPNYQRGVLLISAGATEGHFEGKTPMLREGHQGGLVLTRQCPGSPGTCNPQETGLPGLPMSWSPTLFSGSGPGENHLFLGLKTIEI